MKNPKKMKEKKIEKLLRRCFTPQSVACALAQGRLFCKDGFCVSALCSLQMCLTWCVG
jgi:hypothetical protein